MASTTNAGKRKCSYCNTEIVIKEDKQMWYNERYYHNECFKQFYTKFFNLDPEPLIQDKAILLSYVSQIFDSDYLEQKFSMDLVNLLRKNFTYQGIYASLIYYQEVKKQKLSATYGISTVNLIYTEAKRYYKDLYDRKEKISNQKLDTSNKIIYVTPKSINHIKTVDMSIL